MGRNIFRGKTLILAGCFLLYTLSTSSGEQGLVPEQPSLIQKQTRLSRSAQRQNQELLSESSLPVSVSPSKQFHGGPEVISKHFANRPEVEANFKRILQSPQEQIRIQVALKRAYPYTSFIRSKIAEYSLPPELFFLPVVESMYNPYARSPQGALGIWQFMHHSMSPWMIQNEWVDERRDFWKSTIGALEKLSLNYRYTEDWLLALAAYNCGLNRVLAALRQSPGSSFWDLSKKGLLPRETRAYIPWFLAVARYATHLGRRGIPLTWEPLIEWVQIPISTPIDLRMLAKKAELPLEVLLSGNRELEFFITPPGQYQLKIPKKYEELIRSVLEMEKERLLNFIVHIVQPGDTLYDLSRHYGPPLSMILHYNPNVRPETLQIGRRLLIPKLKDVGPYVPPKVPPKVSQEDLADSTPFSNSYMVRSGDSLWSIARIFQTTVERLSKENGIQPEDPIHPGAILKVP
ncbi:MAG: LysM peptidoglycan-binding domain-containing protein [Spirochaetales bacterium]